MGQQCGTSGAAVRQQQQAEREGGGRGEQVGREGRARIIVDNRDHAAQHQPILANDRIIAGNINCALPTPVPAGG
jgi:hypothetical protein